MDHLIAKHCKVSLPAVVVKYGHKRYVAHLEGGSGACVEGRGETPQAARADLAASLTWYAHVVGPSVVADGEGTAWLLYPGAGPFTWVAQRIAGLRPGGGGSTIFQAPNESAARCAIAEWNKPRDAAEGEVSP